MDSYIQKNIYSTLKFVSFCSGFILAETILIKYKLLYFS